MSFVQKCVYCTSGWHYFNPLVKMNFQAFNWGDSYKNSFELCLANDLRQPVLASERSMLPVYSVPIKVWAVLTKEYLGYKQTKNNFSPFWEHNLQTVIGKIKMSLLFVEWGKAQWVVCHFDRLLTEKFLGRKR